MVERTFFAIDNAFLVDNTTGVGVVNNSSTPDGRIFTYSSGGGASVTLNDTGGSVDTFNDDQSGSHTVVDGGGLVANGTGVESESIIVLRALDGAGNPVAPDITIYVFSQNGNFSDVWGFASDSPLVDGTNYVKISGSNAGSSQYVDFITCFAAGTLIDTADGPMAVEDIQVGQLVWTRDAGLQAVRWASSATTTGNGAFAPVVFAPGALGNTKELIVSQQHRMLVSGPHAEVLFDAPEVFVAAKHLVGLEGVSLGQADSVTYCHFMFDQHQIVRANGVLSESFFLGDSAVNALDIAARCELLSIFPSLRQGFENFGETALMTLTEREAIVWRSMQAQAA